MNVVLATAVARVEQRFGAQVLRSAALAERQASERRIATGTSFDQIAAGGFVPGSPCAIVGPTTCGKISLALSVAAAAQRDGGMAAWVDPVRSFDPLAAAHAGVDLQRLIVLRARTVDQALLATSAALRGGGFRLVVVDTGATFARAFAPDEISPILPAVRGSSAALLILSEERPRRLAVPTYALERVSWERRFGRTAGWVFLIRSARGEAVRFRGGVPVGGLVDLGVSDLGELDVAV